MTANQCGRYYNREVQPPKMRAKREEEWEGLGEVVMLRLSLEDERALLSAGRRKGDPRKKE